MTDLGGFGRKGNDRTSLLEDEVRALRERLSMVPSVWAPIAPPTMTLVLLNGNDVGNGAKGVIYAATVTLAALPDLAADSDVVAGLGRAYLYVDGELAGRVWVRHDRVADALPLVAGDRRRAMPAVSISYGAGSISAYRWEY